MAKVTTAKTTKVKDEIITDNSTELQMQLLVMQKQMAEMQKALLAKDEEVKEAKSEVKATKKEARVIDRNKRVPVRSVTENGLTYVSKASGLTTTWSNFGDEQWLEVEELIRMKSSSPVFLTNPWIVIDDEEMVDYLGLKSIYDKIIAVDELEGFFNLPVTEIESILKTAPKGTKQLVSSKARKLVEAGELDSNKVIKVLEQSLEIDLSMVES